MNCSKCNADIAEGATFCNVCGAGQSPKSVKNKQNPILIPIIAMMSLVTVLIVVLIICYVKDNSSSTADTKVADRFNYQQIADDYEQQVLSLMYDLGAFNDNNWGDPTILVYLNEFNKPEKITVLWFIGIVDQEAENNLISPGEKLSDMLTTAIHSKINRECVVELCLSERLKFVNGKYKEINS